MDDWLKDAERRADRCGKEQSDLGPFFPWTERVLLPPPDDDPDPLRTGSQEGRLRCLKTARRLLDETLAVTMAVGRPPRRGPRRPIGKDGVMDQDADLLKRAIELACLYPMKQAFELLTGMDRLDFTTNQARTQFRCLGFNVRRVAYGLRQTL